MRTLNPVKRYREHCRVVRAQMSDYLDDELDARAAAKVRRHVRMCPNCHRIFENLRRTVEGLREVHTLPTPAKEPQ